MKSAAWWIEFNGNAYQAQMFASRLQRAGLPTQHEAALPSTRVETVVFHLLAEATEEAVNEAVGAALEAMRPTMGDAARATVRLPSEEEIHEEKDVVEARREARRAVDYFGRLQENLGDEEIERRAEMIRERWNIEDGEFEDCPVCGWSTLVQTSYPIFTAHCPLCSWVRTVGEDENASAAWDIQRVMETD